jgi:hypothetical protein
MKVCLVLWKSVSSVCNSVPFFHSFLRFAMRLVSLVLTVVIAVLLCISASLPLRAIPQYSLMTGNRCLTCHVNSQGSGIRTELGWYASKDAGMIQLKDIPILAGLETETNTYFDNSLIIGMDWRGQLARSWTFAEARRRFFPMQLAFYGAYTPTKWLTVEGTFDVASLWGSVRAMYPGQSSWMASVLIQPDYVLPLLRVGHFQPTVGIRYDDHTMLARQVAGAFPQPLLAPYYADWGAEIHYDGLQWLSLTVGAFLPRNLSAVRVENAQAEFVSIVPGVTSETSFSGLIASPTFNARAMTWIRTEDHILNGYVGVSALRNGTFTLANAFAGIGIPDRASLHAEYAVTSITNGQQTRNISSELMVRVVSWLYPYVRYERGVTEPVSPFFEGQTLYTNQAVVGVQWFPIPQFELRPEFRFVDTEAYTSTRWALQVHLFY